MKPSEARIMLLLRHVGTNMRHAGAIACKLDMDYGYVKRMLNTMVYKGWLRRIKNDIKTLYYNNDESKFQEAIKVRMEAGK